MSLAILETISTIFFAVGIGFIVWGAVNWLSNDKTSRPGLDGKAQIIIGLTVMLCTVSAYHILYPICNSSANQEVSMERIKLYSESGILISDYAYVTNVHYTSNGDIAFTADDGTSVIISGGTVVREKQ